VNAFQSTDTDASVMLISLKAGNAGLNLTAADYVFLVDPWWNAAVENQAIDRTHRIGQTQPVFAYRMICKHTVEEKILQLKDRKKKLAESLITTEDGLMQALSIEDVAFLFQ
jgi:SNF2 family DNA or RNA helicase